MTPESDKRYPLYIGTSEQIPTAQKPFPPYTKLCTGVYIETEPDVSGDFYYVYENEDCSKLVYGYELNMEAKKVDKNHNVIGTVAVRYIPTPRFIRQQIFPHLQKFGLASRRLEFTYMPNMDEGKLDSVMKEWACSVIRALCYRKLIFSTEAVMHDDVLKKEFAESPEFGRGDGWWEGY